MSNFDFLNKKWEVLAKLGKQAESYYHNDNNASMLKMRMFGEKLIDYVLAASFKDRKYFELINPKNVSDYDII